jgi:hypothetical protein
MDDGTPVECPPEDVHPHCNCTFDIEYDGEEDRSDEADKYDDAGEKDNN